MLVRMPEQGRITMVPSRESERQIRVDDTVQAAIVRGLREGLGPALRSVVLFGSQASGTARPTSDIDLLLVADELPADTRARDRLAHRLCRLLFGRVGLPVQVVLFAPEELESAVSAFNPLLLSLAGCHRVLLDADGGFKQAADGLRLLFESGRVRSEGPLRWRIPEWQVI
jgi:predicted nucleotidyltransferase